jgi:multidrug efflux system outer membrane protein
MIGLQQTRPGGRIMKYSFRLLPFVFSLLLTSCMVGPDYVRPVAVEPEAWRYQITAAEDVVNTAWWQQFDDPVLDDLVRYALESNKDVRLAAARVEEYAARVDIARAGLYPQLGYDGSAGRFRSSLESGGLPPGASRTNDSYSALLNVGWELDFWGKIRRATEAARAQLLAEEESRRTVILTLVTAVTDGYVLLRALDEQLVIARRTLKSRGDSLHLFQLQFEGGVVSELEIAQLKSEYEQAAVRIPSIERQIALQENLLSVLLGRNPGPIERGKSIDELLMPAVPAGIPSEVLARRPDIRQAEQQLIAANAQIGVAKAQYFPSISLTGLFGYASTALSELFNSAANLWDVSGLVLGPIYTGGALSGQVRVSEAVQRQALEGYLLTVQTAFREVDDALVSYQKFQEELEAQGRRVNALQEYSRLANLRYNEGQVSYIEVLDAERRLFDAELLFTQNQNAVYNSLVAIYKAMGGGWIETAGVVADEVDFPARAKDK